MTDDALLDEIQPASAGLVTMPGHLYHPRMGTSGRRKNILLTVCLNGLYYGQHTRQASILFGQAQLWRVFSIYR